jgi:type IV pilus assembly protein PilC
MQLSERVQFFRELATMVDSGMSLGMSLSTLENRPGSLELRVAVHDCAQKVLHGKRFSEAMRDHPKIFTELNIALVAAGEEGGHLDEILNSIADYLDRDLEFQQTISRETFYPKVLLAAIVLIPLGTRMLIAGISGSMGAALLIGAKFMAGLALFVMLPAYLLYLAYRRYLVTESGRLAVDRFKLHVPMLGTIITKLAWTRMCRALSALYGAGVTLRSAVTVAARTSGNRVFEKALVSTVPALERGEKLSEALARTGQIPPLAMNMLRTGEETGGIDFTLLKVADYYEAEANTTIKKLTVLIVPVCVVIAGIAVVVQMVQFYGGYFGSMMGE